MSKFLATAAAVVGAIAITVASAGTLAPVATAGALSSIGITATAASVAAIASVAAAGLGLVAQLTAKKPSSAGSPTAWQADPDAGIPIVLGSAYNAGKIVYREAYGPKKSKYQTLYTVWSLGPVASIDKLYVDQVEKGVTGQIVDIANRGKMFEARQLGACPEPSNLLVGPVVPYAWTPACKLSGLAATAVTFVYDVKGKQTFTSVPNCGWYGSGVLCYDPRKDDTYPGGSGPQRAGDQTTWAHSRNPYVQGLTWCIGWRQNGKLAAGVGAPLSGIIVEQFVEGANVADVNSWTSGGVKSTIDDKWDVLTDILQAGGGEPIRLGAMLGCVVNTPRVSIATIGRSDLAQGDISVQAMTARRDRINAISPRYMAQSVSTTPDTDGVQVTTTNWADTSGAPIIVDAYVAADGRQRRKAVSYPLVQGYAGAVPKQVAQLARYDIENAREFGPISLPLKLRWMGFKPGDVVTANLPEAGLNGQPIMIRGRALDPGSCVVTITARSETYGKHAFALGQTTTAPPSPSVRPFDDSNPLTDLLATQEGLLISNSYPIGLADNVTSSIEVGGATAKVVIPDHQRAYPAPQPTVAVTGATLTGLALSTTYLIYYDDPDLAGGTVTYHTTTIAADAYYSADNPARHFVAYVTTPDATGSGAGAGGGGPSGGGGWNRNGPNVAQP